MTTVHQSPISTPIHDPKAKTIGPNVDVRSTVTTAPKPKLDLDPKPKDAPHPLSTKDEIDLSELRAAVALVSAGAGGDPPKRPHDDRGKTGHYADHAPLAHVDPALRSALSPVTREQALNQTTAARALLYNPGDTFRTQLGVAASNLHAIASGLPARDQLALGGRLLGSEGLLANQTTTQMLQAIRRVADDPEQRGASATDRAVVLALMGDIGALFADTGATTGVELRSDRQSAILRGRLRFRADNLGLSSFTPLSTRVVKSVGGSKAVGPTKSAERKRPPNAKPPRTGIHNLGRAADDRLGIHPDARLPTTRWDVATIRQDRVFETEEPLVGHMSGSPSEILMTWDMLMGIPGDQQYLGTPEAQNVSDERLARAAGAAAFLVALGYHSAVEVAEGTLGYVGQDARAVLAPPQRDAADLLGHGAATDLMSELFSGQTG